MLNILYRTKKMGKKMLECSDFTSETRQIIQNPQIWGKKSKDENFRSRVTRRQTQREKRFVDTVQTCISVRKVGYRYK